MNPLLILTMFDAFSKLSQSIEDDNDLNFMSSDELKNKKKELEDELEYGVFVDLFEQEDRINQIDEELKRRGEG